MAQFALDALAAKKGDALLLRWDKGTSAHMALIDGGPSPVYATVIQPHLVTVAGVDPVGRPNPVVLDLVVVSHVDDDHINGIIDLANAVDIAQKQAQALPATIGEVWHNAFADMAFLDEFADEPDLQQAIADADASPSSLLPPSAAPRPDPTVGDITAGAQSVAQGRQLDRGLSRIRVPKNTSFGDRGHFVRDGTPVAFEGLRVTVLAPNTGLLATLRKEWKKELAKILKKEAAKRRAAVGALAAAFDDQSVPNQSSIVLLVEFEARTMLLTGDARGDHLLTALAAMSFGPQRPLQVDVFKVPHHGSAHSNGEELFLAITADHYVISGNGEHGNPHPDALTALFATRGDRPITVHLTNRPTAGATKPADVANAIAAQRILDDADKDPDVTVLYRDDDQLAITVELL